MRLNFIGYANTATGYGVATTNMVKALMDAGVEVALFPINNIVDVDDRMTPYILAAIHNATLFDENAPTLKVAEQQFMVDWPWPGRRFALSFFELDRFTAEDQDSMNHADVIFVPSRWAKSIVEKDPVLSGKPVKVCPMGVDRTIFQSKDEDTSRFPAIGDHLTTFVNVGKFEIRKGHDFLRTAINAAFEPSDGIRVVLACHNPFIGHGNRDWRRFYESSKMGRSFIFRERLPDQHSVTRMIVQADCGLFPYRAEGWNLDLLECMSVGLPVIATNYSAPTEYLTSQNARFIEVDELEDARDGVFFQGGKGRWAKLGAKQLEQAVHHLREVHRQKQMGLLKGNEAGIETAKKFSWQNTAESIIQGIFH